MKKKLSKRQDGKRLNEENRLSPLEVIQRRMEYFDQLACDEMALGEEASRECVNEYLAKAQDAAVQLAPYRHPRLQAAAIAHSAGGELADLLKSLDGTSRGLFAEAPLLDLPGDKTTKH